MSPRPRHEMLGRVLRILLASAVCVAAVACAAIAEPSPGLNGWRFVGQVTPASTKLDLEVVVYACANDPSPEGRILDPIIDYRPTTIWITVPVRNQPDAPLDCYSWHSVVVSLREPVGDRKILNGVDREGISELPTNLSPEPSVRPLPPP